MLAITNFNSVKNNKVSDFENKNVTIGKTRSEISFKAGALPVTTKFEVLESLKKLFGFGFTFDGNSNLTSEILVDSKAVDTFGQYFAANLKDKAAKLKSYSHKIQIGQFAKDAYEYSMLNRCIPLSTPQDRILDFESLKMKSHLNLLYVPKDTISSNHVSDKMKGLLNSILIKNEDSFDISYKKKTYNIKANRMDSDNKLSPIQSFVIKEKSL